MSKCGSILEASGSRHFISQEFCHVAHFNWFASLQCPILLVINRRMPLLPSHISHISFLETSGPAHHLEVSSRL